jgi:flavodoxin
MKTMVVYSTITGNTKMVAEAIQGALPGSACHNLKEQPDLEGFDLLILGFWADKGRVNEEMRDYFSQIKNRKAAFFFTQGGYPNSVTAGLITNEAAELLQKNNNTIPGHFHCQGRFSPAVLEAAKTLPPDHPRAGITPERQALRDEAARHPNEEDLAKARAFARQVASL